MLLALGLIGQAPVAAAGQVAVTLNAPDRVLPSSNFTATVDIGEVTDLNGVQYDIVFDPSALRLVNVTPGKVGSTAMPVQGFAEVSPGRYRVLQTLLFAKISGSGYLAVLNFQVVGSPGGSSTINLANGVISDWQAQAIPTTWIGDSVSIGSAESPGGVLPPTVASSPQPEETAGTIVPEGNISQPVGNEGSADSAGTVLETPGAPAAEGNISQPAGNEGSADLAGTVSAESDGEEVSPAASLSPEAGLPPSSEATPVKPLNWPVLWGVIAGVLVAGLLVFLQVRRRAYLKKQSLGDKTNQS